MDHRLRERLKFIAIIVLLFSSILQVGILWGYQNQRTPTSLFSAIFGSGSAQDSDQITRNNLFRPARLVISDGETLHHWIIDRNDSIYAPMWKEVKDHLTSLAENKLKLYKDETAYAEDSSSKWRMWGDISSQRGFMVTFYTGLDPELLKWFLDIKGSQAAVPTVLKVMVVPDKDNETSCEMYIQDDKANVYSYKISNYTMPKSFQEVLTTLSNGGNGGSNRVYSSMRDSNFDKSLNVRPDILYVSGPPNYWEYFEINSSIPQRARNINDLAVVILGSEKGRYTYSRNPNDGTMQLINSYNIYKLYTDGTLTYDTINESEASSRGSIGQALVNAYNYINKVDKLMYSKAGVYLYGVDMTQQGFYSFKFNYIINDLPVYTDYTSENGDGKKPDSAITIDANGDQIIQASWILRDLTEGARRQYNDCFLDYDVNYKALKIENIVPGYLLDSDKTTKLVPSMIIKKMDGAGIMAAQMPERQGN